jgi:DNA-binding NarL/FixJ family response regulator
LHPHRFTVLVMAAPIGITIVEDDIAYRNALATILKGTPGFSCDGVYANAETALGAMAGRVSDVTLVDIHLPGLSGIEFVRKVKRQHPGALMVMLTVVEDAEQIFQALRAGANGYILKRTAPSGILDHIREVMEGGAPMSRAVARKVLQHFHAPARAGVKSTGLSTLTTREGEVLVQLATGQTQKEIAEGLHMAPETVRTHLRSVYRKLHVHSRTEAVIKYLGQD